MSLSRTIRASLAPVHREGWRFIAAFFLAALVLGWFWAPLFWLGLILTGWCAYFFRDPPRVMSIAPGMIVSPADGRVSLIGPAVPPPELDLGAEPMLRISIFMNVFDCHINRAPVSGRIVAIAYRPGKFVNAELDKASEDNERNGIVLETEDCRIGVVQIAGLVARRIVCWARLGQVIGAGDRFGMIRFGSRLDVYMPADTVPQIALGQRAIAGETVIADRHPAARRREIVKAG